MSLDSGTTFVCVNGKAPAQRCSTGRSWDKKHNYQFIYVAMRGEKNNNLEDKANDNHCEQQLEFNLIHKTNCLTSAQKDNFILQRSRGNNKGGIFKDKTPTLSTSSWVQNNLLSIQERIRRLTPTECSRLQTIPSWYQWECSNTQIYKMLGNGWTIDVIVHILSFMKTQQGKFN